MKLIPLLLVGATVALAQTPKPAPLTATEAIAADALHNDITTIESRINRFEEEYTKNHPGWILNIRTGQPEPAPKQEIKAEAKPEPKK